MQSGVVIVKDEKCAREWPREKKKVIELIDEVVFVRCPKTRWRKILEKMGPPFGTEISYYLRLSGFPPRPGVI